MILASIGDTIIEIGVAIIIVIFLFRMFFMD